MKEKSPIEAFEHACIQLRTAQKQPDQMKVIMDHKGSHEEMVEELTEKRKCALDRLKRVVPQSETEQLEIVGALLAEGEPEEARIACELACKPVQQKEEEDPVVGLCDRWLRTKRVYKQMNFDDGSFNSRESRELEQACDAIAEELVRTSPTTPVGVARLLDVYWCEYGRDGLIGSEGWEAEFNRPQMQMLRRIRNGAARVAGYDQMSIATPELGIHEDW